MNDHNLMVAVCYLLLAVAVLEIKHILFPKATPQPPRPPFRFIRPEEALEGDLGRVFHRVHERLHEGKKTDAFPLRINVGQHKGRCYAQQKDIPEIIGALLENEGWVVWKSDKCGPNEMMVDVPRKKFRSKAENASPEQQFLVQPD